MYCGKCGAKLPEGAKFCGKCGTPVKRGKHGSYDPHGGIHTPKWVKVVLVSLLLVVGTGVFLGALLGGDERIDNPIPPQANSIDECYTPNVENIVFEDDSKTFGYVNNMVLLFAYSYTPQERVFEIADEIGGEIIGQIPEVYQYQIQVSPRSREELESLCDRLMDYEEVKYAQADDIAATVSNTLWTPNDPWKDKYEGSWGVDWNEDKPGGYNWWLEATRVISAWQHRSSFSPVKIGVVDKGFDTGHEDLKMTILDAKYNHSNIHGTLVAGIIGATVDNNIGVSGAFPKADLYCVDCYYVSNGTSANGTSTSAMLNSIAECFVHGCKVINLSSGIKYVDNMVTDPFIEEYARTTIKSLIILLDSRESKSDDFIVVESAGNGDKPDDLSKSKGLDARQFNGYYASITEDLAKKVLAEFKEEVLLENNITVTDIMNSFMVVAAVDKNKKKDSWQLARFSNYGNTITVCAPGTDIYSTIATGTIDGNYGSGNGTSFAAPIVSGITAMVWSIDPEMSAAEVKQIITSTANIPVLSRQKADRGTYHMVNAGAAVEEALKRKASKDHKTSGSDLVLGTPNPGSNPTATPAPTPEPSTFVLETLPPTQPSGGNIPDEALRALEQAGGDVGPLGDGEHIVQLDKSLLFESADGTYAVVTIMEPNTYADEYVHSLRIGDEINGPYLPVTDIEFSDAFDGSGQVFSFGDPDYYMAQVNGVWYMFRDEYMCTYPAGSTLILIPHESNFYDGMDYRDQSENDGPGYFGNYYPEHRVGNILDVFTASDVYDDYDTYCHVIVKLRNGAATDVYRFYEP